MRALALCLTVVLGRRLEFGHYEEDGCVEAPVDEFCYANRSLTLSTYDEVVARLLAIQALAAEGTTRCGRPLPRVQVGPLVMDEAKTNGGLVDVDVPHDKTTACGGTLREAVVCTNADGIGNLNASKVGFSTQGKVLWGARIGNIKGQSRKSGRLFVSTQKHGNEGANTEAVLDFLEAVVRCPESYARALESLDVLFALRVNVDGGEISCAQNVPVLGEPFAETCGYLRHSVDPEAGGGYVRDSEEDFIGSVGVGYNLNRYNFPSLTRPIRPVEMQAFNAVLLAFDPSLYVDLHGDQPKTICDIDPSTIRLRDVPGLATLPAGDCVEVALADNETLATFYEGLVPLDQMLLGGLHVTDAGDDLTNAPVRTGTLAAKIAEAASHLGPVARFAQVQLGTGGEGGGASRNEIPLQGFDWMLVESWNFEVDMGLYVPSVVNGTMSIGANVGAIDPEQTETQILYYSAVIEAIIATVGRWESDDGGVPTSLDPGYCAMPPTTGTLVAGSVVGLEPINIPMGFDLVPVFSYEQRHQACDDGASS